MWKDLTQLNLVSYKGVRHSSKLDLTAIWQIYQQQKAEKRLEVLTNLLLRITKSTFNTSS